MFPSLHTLQFYNSRKNEFKRKVKKKTIDSTLTVYTQKNRVKWSATKIFNAFPIFGKNLFIESKSHKNKTHKHFQIQIMKSMIFFYIISIATLITALCSRFNFFFFSSSCANYSLWLAIRLVFIYFVHIAVCTM